MDKEVDSKPSDSEDSVKSHEVVSNEAESSAAAAASKAFDVPNLKKSSTLKPP